MTYHLALAGSTKKTLQVAQTLLLDTRFEITLIITPQSKPVGRQQVLTENPVHQFAQKNNLATVLVDGKINQATREKIEQNFIRQPFDFLLVVDFGYLIPQWLLNLPKISPLNIHPSRLPRWRGSSPGQFALLNGDSKSAVTLMVMSKTMDEGPVIAQLLFAIKPTWTQTEYYQHAFNLICQQLGDLIEQFAKGELKAKPQPTSSPTPVAKRLIKQDSFYDWSVIKQAIENGIQAVELERACRAFYPWPKLWTKVPTNQGEKRLIIHSCRLNRDDRLVLDKVQLEGKNKVSWSEIKPNIKA
ncbi:MAG TPA: formyltransferase family protein [Patescibacteria group bacterium]|jgi:methionyl-tRNA formyltransferase